MTGAERQALRDKHHRDQYGLCAGCGSRTLDGGTSTIEWRFCDVIKVLDALDTTQEELDKVYWAWEEANATENLNLTNLKTEVECDHEKHYYGWLTSNNGDTLYHVEFTYCPKCGEKL